MHQVIGGLEIGSLLAKDKEASLSIKNGLGGYVFIL